MMGCSSFCGNGRSDDADDEEAVKVADLCEAGIGPKKILMMSLTT